MSIRVVHEERKVKIRKNHQCHYCLRTINKGSEMYVSTYESDGEIYDLYKCIDCNDFLLEADQFLIEELLYDDAFYEGCIRDLLRGYGFTIEKKDEFFEKMNCKMNVMKYYLKLI